MRLPLVAMTMSLLCDAIRSQSRPDAERRWPESCGDCKECSRDNGCVRCAERLFLLLRRRGAAQRGTCLPACPKGYFGQRGRHLNRCLRCRSANCEHCFSRDFCTQCKSGFRLYSGRCLSACPAGTSARDGQCQDECASGPASEWSEWSACLRDGAPCGFRWGWQSRQRGSADADRTACPSRSQSRRCRMKRRCPTGDGRARTRGRDGRRQRKPLWMLATANASNARRIF